jgi:hypothetical protein
MITAHQEKECQTLIHEFVMEIYKEAHEAYDNGCNFYYVTLQGEKYEPILNHFNTVVERLQKLFPRYAVYTTYADKKADDFVEYEVKDRRDLYDMPENFVQCIVINWT